MQIGNVTGIVGTNKYCKIKTKIGDKHQWLVLISYLDLTF